MYFTSFYSYYPKVAEKETRVITVRSTEYLVPLGSYALIENYCEDDTCDCRKVMINFVDAINPNKIFATIGYGWEPLVFYTKWLYGDTKVAKNLVGTYLEPGGIQTKYAFHFLKLFENVCLDKKYKERIKRHYELVKGKTLPMTAK